MAKIFSEKIKSKSDEENEKLKSEEPIDNLNDEFNEEDIEDADDQEEPNQDEETAADNLASPDIKLAEMQDKYLRLSAEFDNYRKRTLKEKSDLIRTASENLILKIIPVLDDFERAIGFINDEAKIDESKEGIYLIYNKMKAILIQQGLKEIESLHNDFDTDIHEAITKIPAPDKKLKGKVVDVIQKGYMLGDKVIRYAKVVIGE